MKARPNAIVFPAELAQCRRKAGARQGSTLFATLLAGFSLLIHRLCQQDDVVIGIPMAGQSQLENGSTLFGHCVNFLPIRSRYSAGTATSQFLKQTRKTLLDAQDHQDYTYGTLLRKAQDSARSLAAATRGSAVQCRAGRRGLNFDASRRSRAQSQNQRQHGSLLQLRRSRHGVVAGLRLQHRPLRRLNHRSLVRPPGGDPARPSPTMHRPTPAEVSLLTAAQIERDSRRVEPAPRRLSARQLRFIASSSSRPELTPDAVAVIARAIAYLCRVERESQPTGTFPENPASSPAARVAVCLDRSLEVYRQPARHPQGRRGLCAGRSQLPSLTAHLSSSTIRRPQVLLTQRSIAATSAQLPSTSSASTRLAGGRA